MRRETYPPLSLIEYRYFEEGGGGGLARSLGTTPTEELELKFDKIRCLIL